MTEKNKKMYKLNKIRGFVALPILIGGAVIAAGLVGGLIYKYENNQSVSSIVNKDKMLAQVSSVANTTAPIITVTSPNGGETFALGGPITINWISSGVPTDSVALIAFQDQSGVNTYISSSYDWQNNKTILMSSGSYTTNLPINMQPGKYKIRVACSKLNSDAYCISSDPRPEAWSNNYFTVSAPTPLINCSELQSNPSTGVYFEMCKDQGNNYNPNKFNYVAFDNNKTYSGCTTIKSGCSGIDGCVSPSLNYCDLSNITPYKILSPNGGETLQAGQTYPITWIPGSINNLGAYINLSDLNNTVVQQNIISAVCERCMYNWTIPSNLPAGKYKLSIVLPSNGSVADYSDDYFTIVNTKQVPTNGSPTITSTSTTPITAITSALSSSQISAAVSLLRSFGANEVTANGVQSILSGQSVGVGTEQVSLLTAAQVSSITNLIQSFGASASIIFAVQNFLATGSTPAVTTLATSTPEIMTSNAIKIAVSNDGKALVAGKTYTVSWEGSDLNNSFYSAFLVGGGLGTGKIDFGSVNQTSTATNSASITIPPAIPSANTYRIQFIGKATEYDSDPFSIINNSSNINDSSPVSITVLSPSGDEQFAVGAPITIKWFSSGNIPDGAMAVISLVDEKGFNNYLTSSYSSDNKSVLFSSGSYTANLPTDIPLGVYTIRVACVNSNSDAYCNNSSNSQGFGRNAFTISSSASVLNNTSSSSSSDAVPAQSGSSLLPSQIEAIINLLQRLGVSDPVISKVQSALTGQAASAVQPVQWCHTFNNNFGIGSSGAEVSALQTALQKENLAGSIYQSGVYDESVAALVTGFQEKYKSDILAPLGLFSGTGYVGQSTRNKLNMLYGCNN